MINMSEEKQNPYDKAVNAAINLVREKGYAYTSCISDTFYDEFSKIRNDLIKSYIPEDCDEIFGVWDEDMNIATEEQLWKMFRNSEGILEMRIPEKYEEMCHSEYSIFALDCENLKKGYDEIISMSEKEEV